MVSKVREMRRDRTQRRICLMPMPDILDYFDVLPHGEISLVRHEAVQLKQLALNVLQQLKKVALHFRAVHAVQRWG